MAYMLVIIRAHQEYDHPQWRNYDEAFRDKAATTGNKKWASIDIHIYNQVFTGRARKSPICLHCGAGPHRTDANPQVGPPARKRFAGDPAGIGWPLQAALGNVRGSAEPKMMCVGPLMRAIAGSGQPVSFATCVVSVLAGTQNATVPRKWETPEDGQHREWEPPDLSDKTETSGIWAPQENLIF